jgi:hypothetical protein
MDSSEVEMSRSFIGSLKIVARELAKYKLHLVRVKVRLHKNGIESADNFIHFSVDTSMRIITLTKILKAKAKEETVTIS